MSIDITDFQKEMMKSAKRGFCYDSNPSTWDDRVERKQMEELVKKGFMIKLKNHSGDKHGFYALTDEGKSLIAKAEPN